MRCLAVGDSVRSDVLENGAAFLFQLFMQQTRVTASETLELRRVFGHHTTADAQLICDTVQR